MTDFSLTTLVSEGEALKNSPIATSAIDALVECLFCGWKQNIRFNARHVVMLSRQHFNKIGDFRQCRKRK